MTKKGSVASVKPRTRRRDGGEGRRPELLQFAAQAFSQQGYAAASMRDIAELAGIKAPSFYHHFGYKEELPHAIVVDTLYKIFEMLLAEVSKSGTPEEKLRDVVAAHMNFVIENRLHTKVVFEEATFLHERDFAGVRAKQRSIFDIYRRLVSNLINEGEVGDYDPAIAALNILGIIHGVYRWYDPERENSDKIVEQSLRLILDGLRVR